MHHSEHGTFNNSACALSRTFAKISETIKRNVDKIDDIRHSKHNEKRSNATDERRQHVIVFRIDKKIDHLKG